MATGSESNDAIAFPTVIEEKEQNKLDKKKEIVCFRCEWATTLMNMRKNYQRHQREQ